MDIIFMNDDFHIFKETDGRYRVVCIEKVSLIIESGDGIETQVNAQPLGQD